MRSLARVVDLPAPHPGQFGPHHRVVEVLRPDDWARQDPFILLMDDRADGVLEAGPHPHVGFETVTFPIEGTIPSEGGSGALAPGDVEWTTAGSGIVHGPERPMSGRFRLLQLWLVLPKALRWTDPDHQLIRGAEVPVRREPGVEARLYSGRTGELVSPTRNRVPVTLVDVRLDAGAAVDQVIPPGWNGFLYVLEGEVAVAGRAVRPGQVGWLDRGDDPVLRLVNPGTGSARVLLYAGEPQRTPIVSYGPFIGDSREDIVRAFEGYRAGTFRRI